MSDTVRQVCDWCACLALCTNHWHGDTDDVICRDCRDDADYCERRGKERATP